MKSKKYIIIFIVFGLINHGFSQININQKKTLKFNSIQKGTNQLFKNIERHSETGYLLNRTFSDTSSTVYKVQNKPKDSAVDVNTFYKVIRELNLMSIEGKTINLDSLYLRSSIYLSKMEFENNRATYPVGIIDYTYDYFEISKNKKNSPFKLKGKSLFLRKNTPNIMRRGKIQLTAPLYNYVSLEKMGIVFQKENFFSNYHEYSDIKKIEVSFHGKTQVVHFGEVFEFTPVPKEVQYFHFKIYYKDGTSFANKTQIITPNPRENGQIQSRAYQQTPWIYWYKEEKIGKLKLKAYFIPGCNNNSVQPAAPSHSDPDRPAYIPMKPYILVTGYRPPIFGQSAEKTWNIYNDNHGDMLNQLRLNGYDIILVKFNMNVHPNKLGIKEAADLLIKYIEDLNQIKEQYGYGYNENVIQGSSMGASVTRLALLKMENKHLNNNNYPHHHCRLFLSYDANYYGANLPLSYQLQAYSGTLFPVPVIPILSNIIPIVGSGASIFLQKYLVNTLEQKATKELLMYHARGIGNKNFVLHKNSHKTWQPTHTYLRQSYLNEVNSLYNQVGYYPHGKLFMPMPISTRNIAISLGKISQTNDHNSQNLDFNTAGENWRSIQIKPFYIHFLRAGQYQSSKMIFYRQVGIDWDWLFFHIHLNVVNQELKVRNMQEIDNASGSYLKGMGNFLAVTNIAYGFNWANIFSQPKFTHKPVVSALAINSNLWPSNGAMTLNMQNLDLMYNKFNYNPSQPSDYYGYPNLGRPNDHWDITPFEAIYVSDYIIPHIDLEEVKPKEDYIYPINDFIKNEVEPCYLSLQNQHLGAQARSNYTYKAERRANNVITTGYLVTPKTDPGNYVVEPNADLILEAGQAIVLKPGTHIKAGATAHLWIHYEKCEGKSRPCSTQSFKAFRTNGKSNSERKNNREDNHPVRKKIKEQQENAVNIFPNPTHNHFTITTQQKKLSKLDVYTLSGKRLKTIQAIDNKRYIYQETLEKGTYLLLIKTKDGELYHKKIVVL